MGDQLVRRLLLSEMIHRIPKDLRHHAWLLAYKAYDQDEIDPPCCFAKLEELVPLAERDNSDAAQHRFRRAITRLEEVGYLLRTSRRHQGRKSRNGCPRDGREFHVELIGLVAAARPLYEGEVVAAARPLTGGDSGHPTAELVATPRPPLISKPIQTPSSSRAVSSSARVHPENDDEDDAAVDQGWIRSTAADVWRRRRDRRLNEWHRPGIEAVLRELVSTMAPAELRELALIVAADPAAQTPRMIAIRQPRTEPVSEPSGPLCDTCRLPERRCREMAKKTGDPHPFISTASKRRADAASDGTML